MLFEIFVISFTTITKQLCYIEIGKLNWKSLKTKIYNINLLITFNKFIL